MAALAPFVYRAPLSYGKGAGMLNRLQGSVALLAVVSMSGGCARTHEEDEIESRASALTLDFGKCSKLPTSLTTGFLLGCALLSDGTVECWGGNDLGQLGIGQATTAAPFGIASPVPVPGLEGVRAIAGGMYHTCALL